MTVNKIIYTEKSIESIINYLHTLDFFHDFLKIVDPIKYEIISDSDIENTSVTWPLRIIYEDNPNIPIINHLIPKLQIEQIWSFSDNIINIRIKGKFLESQLFEMKFTCILRYLGDIDIEGKWVEKSFLVPNIVLSVIIDQFEEILKIIL